MNKTPYLYLRGRQWWYRRRVPSQIVSIIGKSEFDEPLKTSDRDEATLRVALRNAQVALKFQIAIAQLKSQPTKTTPALHSRLSPQIIQYIRQAVYAHVMQEDETVRDSWLTEDNLVGYETFRSNQFYDLEEALNQMGQNQRVDDHTKNLMDEALQAVGVDLPRNAETWNDAARAAANGMLAALRSTRPRMAPPPDSWQYVPSPEMPHKPSDLRLQSAPDAVLRLGVVIDDYLANLKQTGFTRKVKRCLQLFGEIVGRDTPVRELKQRLITDFLRTVCKLPLEWAKQYDKGVSVASMLAKDSDKAMGPTTYVDNYRAPLGSFLAASLRDHGDDGFPARTVNGIEYSGNRVAEEDKQRALRPEELQTLYEGERFAAIASDSAQEALYWFAVVLLFTGARPRELCQTNPQVDFGLESGHWFMEISETTLAGKGVSKSVKTGEGRRVPFHPELVRLGFHEYVKRIKEAGADRLFPSFRVKAGNTYTANGNLFTDLLKATGLYTRNSAPGELVTGAYVLRKTFITFCRNQGVISKEITGHADGSTTEVQEKHYISGPEPLLRKAQQLEKLNLPVQIPRSFVFSNLALPAQFISGQRSHFPAGMGE